MLKGAVSEYVLIGFVWMLGFGLLIEGSLLGS